MQCLAQTQSPKIRVNSVIPGLLLTEWGNRYSADFIEAWKEATPLKTIVSRPLYSWFTLKLISGGQPAVEDAAETFVSIATNSSLTGAEIPVGQSFSRVSRTKADQMFRLRMVDISLGLQGRASEQSSMDRVGSLSASDVTLYV
jgi:hypothetical protein